MAVIIPQRWITRHREDERTIDSALSRPKFPVAAFARTRVSPRFPHSGECGYTHVTDWRSRELKRLERPAKTLLESVPQPVVANGLSPRPCVFSWSASHHLRRCIVIVIRI